MSDQLSPQNSQSLNFVVDNFDEKNYFGEEEEESYEWEKWGEEEYEKKREEESSVSSKEEVEEAEEGEGDELEETEFSDMVRRATEIATEHLQKLKDKKSRPSLGISGVARIHLSPLTQKIVGCVIDENVTTEFPWVYVRKEIIEDNLDLHSESSDFLPFQEDILKYPNPRMLIGYAPAGSKDEGQFYICLTEEGLDGVTKHIEKLRQEQQARVYKAVYKTPGDWAPLGSAEAVDEATIKTSRPLFQIEVESQVSQLKLPVNLVDRTSEDQKDGYIELLPYRESFENVERMLVDKALKVSPSTAEEEAQTATAMQVNSMCQCVLDRKSSHESASVDEKGAEQLIKLKADEVCEQIFSNTTWDVYANDYANLAAEAAEMRTSGAQDYVEWKSYYDGKLCKGRVINDLAWHPLWTGVVAAAYTTASKPEYLVGPKPPPRPVDDSSQVLVWSFDDCLKPKLILESKRQVTAVSFCPRNGNVIVGGCTNGQIAVWDISGKIEDLEKVVVRTAAQSKHETLIKNLSTWMKEWRASSVLRPTVTSSLEHSPRGAITKIEWLPPYYHIDDKGGIHESANDAKELDLSLQFLTSSEDGSVAFWDLNWRPSEDASMRKKQQPTTLAEALSTLKLLNNVFKPIYILIVQTLNETRNAVVTSVNLRSSRLMKKQVEPIPKTADVESRRYYAVELQKQEMKLIRKNEDDDTGDKDELVTAELFVTTARGECGLITWEGFEFSTGSNINQEVCKWTWCRQIHDGPVSHAVRSPYLEDILLTVGGRVFAIWREDFDQPVLWRKSLFRYTACSWDNNKPTVIILGRNDGTVEIWDFLIKSHEPNRTKSLSGRIITGIYAHELPLNPQCIGFCDFNGALRIFLAPKTRSLEPCDPIELNWMRQLVDREVKRIKDLAEYQEQQQEEAEKPAGPPKAAETEEKMRAEAQQLQQQELERIKAARKARADQRKNLIERIRARWVTRELNRMQRIILESKGLKGEELERRREPVLRMKREAREKEAKRQQAVERADDYFLEAVTSNFPQQKQALLALPADGQREPRPEEPPADKPEAEQDRLLEQFEALEREALARLSSERHVSEFNWRRILKEGIELRRSMDVTLKSRAPKPDPDESLSNQSDRTASSLRSISSSDL